MAHREQPWETKGRRQPDAQAEQKITHQPYMVAVENLFIAAPLKIAGVSVLIKAPNITPRDRIKAISVTRITEWPAFIGDFTPFITNA